MTTVEEVAARIAEESGLRLYDVERQGGTLVVLLDGPGGVDVDRLAAASRAISRAFDDEDLVPGSYTLEVSSPGLERRLRTAEHFAGAVGSRVTLTLRGEVEGDRRILGALASADADRLTVALDDGTTRTVDLDRIDRARTVFEWGGTPPPGSSNQRQRARGNSEANP